MKRMRKKFSIGAAAAAARVQSHTTGCDIRGRDIVAPEIPATHVPPTFHVV